ncbi:MAG: carotenoid biosynthesis protein [Anaerolineales bacterium]|nr:carotenoid biosynthesis protein [Anaerolineales bacterium]
MQPLLRLDPAILIMLAVWALTFISLPIVRWALGDESLRIGIEIGVLTQVATVIVILWRAWKPGRVLGLAASVAILAWAAEYLGSTTGLPFGRYHYTELLQPQVGKVPVLIPLAWLMMLPPSWAVASLIFPFPPGGVGRRRKGQLIFALLSALAMTAWDLFLDPQMVAWGFWTWEVPSGYFGIPWTNFLGWLLVAFLVTLIIRPRDLPVSPLAAVYCITWFLESFGQLFFWDLPGPAVCGFLGMGAVLFWAFLRQIQRSTTGSLREVQ